MATEAQRLRFDNRRLPHFDNRRLPHFEGGTERCLRLRKDHAFWDGHLKVTASTMLRVRSRRGEYLSHGGRRACYRIGDSYGDLNGGLTS